MSLQSRLDIICDEADGETGLVDTGTQKARGDADSLEVGDGMSGETPVSQIVLQSLRKACSLSLPRRVFIPWLAGTFVCDYLQPSETFEALKDRCVELLSMDVPTDASKVFELEREAPSVVTKSFWDVAVPLSTASLEGGLDTSRGEIRQKSINTTDVKITSNIVGAVLFLITAIILGYILVSVKS